MAYIKVDEDLFDEMLHETLNNKGNHNCDCGGDCNCHTHNLSDEFIQKEVKLNTKENKFKKIITNTISNQIETVQDYANENLRDAEELAFLNELDDLKSDLNQNLRNSMDVLGEVISDEYHMSKDEFLETIGKEKLYRAVDDTDKTLLKWYGETVITRLSNDVQEKIIDMVVTAITDDISLKELNKRFNKFLTEEKLRGNHTAASRIKLISIDILQRIVSTAKLQGMLDFGMNKIFVRPYSGNPCETCKNLYLKSPHPIKHLQDKYPVHVLCSCELKKAYLEEPTDDPVKEAEYVNLCRIYREDTVK